MQRVVWKAATQPGRKRGQHSFYMVYNFALIGGRYGFRLLNVGPLHIVIFYFSTTFVMVSRTKQYPKRGVRPAT